jgi:hypothetical protein
MTKLTAELLDELERSLERAKDYGDLGRVTIRLPPDVAASLIAAARASLESGADDVWVGSHTGTSGRVYRNAFLTKAEAEGYLRATPTASNPTARCYVPAPSAAVAEPMAGWVAVSERLPEKWKHVLVDGGTAYVDTGGEWRTTNGTQRLIEWPVTHWMPLPSPPKVTP